MTWNQTELVLSAKHALEFHLCNEHEDIEPLQPALATDCVEGTCSMPFHTLSLRAKLLLMSAKDIACSHLTNQQGSNLYSFRF